MSDFNGFDVSGDPEVYNGRSFGTHRPWYDWNSRVNYEHGIGASVRLPCMEIIRVSNDWVVFVVTASRVVELLRKDSDRIVMFHKDVLLDVDLERGRDSRLAHVTALPMSIDPYTLKRCHPIVREFLIANSRILS